MVNYNVEVEYSHVANVMKVPDSLLKNDQAKNTFLVAERMEQDLDNYKQFKERKQASQ